MSTDKDVKKHVEPVAESTLETFETVSKAAGARISAQLPTSPGEALASVNWLTSHDAVMMLDKIKDENVKSLRHLLQEPAIARIVVKTGTGEIRTYYICRTSPVSLPEGTAILASYRSPVGSLASLPVGEELELKNGELLEVAERALLHPVRNDQDWDSRDTILEGTTYGPLTVQSLRSLLSRVDVEGVDEELLDRLLSEEMDASNVRLGIRRAVLTRMELRDQPVLDKFQDTIFRLPLNSSLLLLGPPGTGKTTTLIRRLGQKLDMEFLSEDERLLIQNLSGQRDTAHNFSWLMFTPTTLLQQYVKESFSREGVPASDRHVRTWADYRRELARNALGLLRTTTRRSGFVLQESVGYLSEECIGDLTGWFDDFEDWQQSVFVARIRTAAEELASIAEGKLADIGEELLSSLDSDREVDVVRVINAVRARSEGARQLTTDLTSEINSSIRRALVLQVNRDSGFLDELAAFLDTLGEASERSSDDGDVGDDEEDYEDDEDEGETTPRAGRRAAEAAYRRAVRAQARAEASGRTLRKGTKTSQVVEWIGDRGLGGDERRRIGRNVLVRARVNSLVNPVKTYVDRMPSRYRAYRRARQSEGRWYLKEAFRQSDIHPLELDMLLLSILRTARILLESTEARRDLQDPFWSTLRSIHDSYRNQIFVDEATDFSPVQLSCMAALSHPATRSFFACGDFNQRLTVWGTRSSSEIAWIDAQIDIERVTIGYRQSKELNDFARQVVRLVGGAEHDVVLPEYADREGARPVLAENIVSDTDAGRWLANRIVEIESFVGQLPSIAILVPDESRVVPIATALGEALSDHNVNVVACANGQFIGQDNDIRVFDAQHIKGLEFESVFFIDVDVLADKYPDLFDKYLYVGATRAATYLGLTCYGTFPAKISELRSVFVSGWSG